MKRIVVISHNEYLHNETDIVNKLFDVGLYDFHLRKKTGNVTDFKKYIGCLNTNFHNKITLHSNYEFTSDFNVKGIHIGYADLIENINRNNNIVSVSAHSLDELENLENILNEKDKKIQYAFLSPVFDSISKKEYKSKFNLTDLKNYFHKNRFSFGVFALGGIDDSNISDVFETGFDGAALLGYIWKNPDPLNNFIRIKQLCNL